MASTASVHRMSEPRPVSAVTIDECNRWLDELEFVDVRPIVEDLAQDWIVARVPIEGIRLRPGGYVPGPTMMAVVDLLGWFLVFTRKGFTPMALTWDLSINFLRPAHGADLVVTARQTKFGKLCHASFELALDGSPDRLVAHATTTYVLPVDASDR